MFLWLKLIKPAIMTLITVGFVVNRRQKNKLRKELIEVKEDLKTESIRRIETENRAERAEETLRSLVEKKAEPQEEPQSNGKSDTYY